MTNKGFDLKEFLLANRSKIFPYIDDFSREHKRFKEANFFDLNIMDAFWFHPYSYIFINWLIPITGILFFGLIALKLMNIFSILCLVVIALCIRKIIDNIKDHKRMRVTNYYNMYVRD